MTAPSDDQNIAASDGIIGDTVDTVGSNLDI
jgi:hypothetical protein